MWTCLFSRSSVPKGNRPKASGRPLLGWLGQSQAVKRLRTSSRRESSVPGATRLAALGANGRSHRATFELHLKPFYRVLRPLTPLLSSHRSLDGVAFYHRTRWVPAVFWAGLRAQSLPHSAIFLLLSGPFRGRIATGRNPRRSSQEERRDWMCSNSYYPIDNYSKGN